MSNESGIKNEAAQTLGHIVTSLARNRVLVKLSVTSSVFANPLFTLSCSIIKNNSAVATINQAFTFSELESVADYRVVVAALLQALREKSA